MDLAAFEDAFSRFVVERMRGQSELWDLDNPVGLSHPAMELHHFGLTGTYTQTNTVLLEYIPEKLTL